MKINYYLMVFHSRTEGAIVAEANHCEVVMGLSASCIKQRRSKNYHFSGVILNGNYGEGILSKHDVTTSNCTNRSRPLYSITSSGNSHTQYDGVVVNKGFELPLYDKSPFRVKRNFSASTDSTSTGRSPLTDKDVSSFFTDSLLDLPDTYYEYGSSNRPLSCHL